MSMSINSYSPIVIAVNSAPDSAITAPITTKSPLNLKKATLSTTFFKLFPVNEKPTSDQIKMGKCMVLKINVSLLSLAGRRLMKIADRPMMIAGTTNVL